MYSYFQVFWFKWSNSNFPKIQEKHTCNKKAVFIYNVNIFIHSECLWLWFVWSSYRELMRLNILIFSCSWLTLLIFIIELSLLELKYLAFLIPLQKYSKEFLYIIYVSKGKSPRQCILIILHCIKHNEIDMHWWSV